MLLTAQDKYLPLPLYYCNHYLIADKNVALNKKAYQSSTHAYKARNGWRFDGKAKNAVDGILASVRTASCTHTNEDKFPWWAVDLLYRYFVNEVNVTNRLDCCGELCI